MNIQPPFALPNLFDSALTWVLLTVALVITALIVAAIYRFGDDDVAIKNINVSGVIVVSALVCLGTLGASAGLQRDAILNEYKQEVVAPLLRDNYGLNPVNAVAFHETFEAVKDGQLVEVRLIKVSDGYLPFVDNTEVPKRP